ncbi:ubiquinol-cytochrome C chaperone family protein [Candidatus Pelagibacter sp.]|nr:ubiquinol-cytochrome C chaperone family protein [Candidatus Pelagibacter sp.]|tara:strand:+ start:76 stop:540 length:465 start_codon:yes stop_codon:yes gene_type:complete
MKNLYLDIYNNLIRLTRNKNLYNNKELDTFYDRMIIFFFHLSFLLKENKDKENSVDLQEFFDFCIRQIELSIREIGYGDATINKKMKDYINLLYSIIDKVHNWETIDDKEKSEILKKYIDISDNSQSYIDYFENFRDFLIKNSFKNLSKHIISF